MKRAAGLVGGLALLALAACAREGGPAKSSRGPAAPVQPLPPPPQPTAPPTVPPHQHPPPPPAPTMSNAERTEFFRAQDACLNDCDQFACMTIAEAYQRGDKLPRDVLAGRRYAIHACLECGAPGMAIADRCPTFGLRPKK